MILDATAGNRAIYQTKYSENIIYLDRQKKLERKPTVFADFKYLPFKENVFDTILFDPPYYWGTDNPWYTIPDSATYFKRFGEYRRAPRYYGVDQYPNKTKLINALFFGLKELGRVLKSDGLLWLKWCEVKMRLVKLEPLLEIFNEMLRLEIKDKLQTHSSCQTYWVAFMKNGLTPSPALDNWLV